MSLAEAISATEAEIKVYQGEIDKLRAEVDASRHEHAKIDEKLNLINNAVQKGHLAFQQAILYQREKDELRKAKESHQCVELIKLQSIVDLLQRTNGLFAGLVSLERSHASQERTHLIAQGEQVKRQKLKPAPTQTLTPSLIDKHPDHFVQALNNALFEEFKIKLRESIIQLPQEFVSSGLSVGSVLGMDFLDPLRLLGAKETFLPRKIFVRECMKHVFDLFRKDTTKEGRRAGWHHTVLIGSPGVGKSALFFLAALDQARSSPILYLRRTTSERKISIFLMLPIDEGTVRVLFSRELVRCYLQRGLVDLQRLFEDFIMKHKTALSSKQLYYYVDGPNHKDLNNTLDGHCDYFCTGGHPFPPQARLDFFSTWVLDGWTKAEAIQGMGAVCDVDVNRAGQLYDLCGGSIRNMIRAFGNFDKVKQEQDCLLTRHLNDKEADIAVLSTERGDNDITTMFQTNLCPVNFVDSTYMLTKLCQRLSLSKWVKAYTLGTGIEDATLKEIFFERCIHSWFTEAMPPPINRVCWSEGTTLEEGIDSLNDRGVYWIPSESSFPNIGSAVVIGNKLYTLQITCKAGKKHNFDHDTFFNTFVERVQALFNNLLKQVNVILVVPMECDDASLGCQHDNLISTVHHVDTSSLAAFDKTMKKLPFLSGRR